MRAYERLLQYARVYTTSDPESGTHPSAAREFDLAHMLVEEMKNLGIEDARVDEHCYVYGTLPATPGCEKLPALGLIAHMDTAPDASGENVNPILHENYDGNDVTLPATGMVMKTSTFPFLKELKGETLITTDGTTLLGADDKAGVAEIMTAAETLLAEGRPHGKVCIAFTPDEEIGEGASLFDIPGFGADFAYTVDGGDVGGIEYENFNAASATVTIHGFSVHPGSAKDAMINASNVALEFHSALPVMARPETTEGYQGFYHLCQMYGDVTDAKLGYILRDHDAQKLQYKKDNLMQIAAYLNGKYGEGTVEVEIKDSYRNMIEKIKPHFHLVENARKAIRMAGLEPEEEPVRGGTDGATLSWNGLPCPNLGTGGFNFHGVCECTTVERMDKATEILLNIKGIVLTSEYDEPVVMYLRKSGKGEATAGDITPPAGVTIANPDMHIATLAEDGELEIEFTVERGRGYVPAQMNKQDNAEIGRIPVDSIYSPVLKVSYRVEATRVEQRTDFDKLILDVETKPAISPRDAVASAGSTLVELFGLCRELNTQAEGVEVGPAPVAEETNPEMNIPIEDLNLTQRSYNCLKREGIHTIGELVAHTEQDLLDIRNFGMKSIDEVKEKLQSLGLALKASPLGNFDTNNLEGGTFFSPEDE